MRNLPRFPQIVGLPLMQSFRYPQAVSLSVLALALAGCATRSVGTDVPTTPVNYYVRVERAKPDRFEVSVALDHVRRDSIDYVLPAWIPGRFEPLEPAPVEGFTVRDGHGEPVTARQLDANRWRVYPGGEKYLTIGYQVKNGAGEVPLAVAPRVDRRSGYALGASLFGFVDGHELRSVTVSFELPAGWELQTALTPTSDGRYEAPSFGELPGSVFALGDRLLDYKLFVEGRPHRVVVQGVGRGFAPDSLLTLVEEAIQHGTRFFGSPPYERYVFVFHFVDPGTEGIGATGQAAGSAYYLPIMDNQHMRRAGLGKLLLHHYLHAWYPGQFGPRKIAQPDFSVTPDIAEQWLIEGAAEYYARLLPARYAGGPDGFYAAMGELLTWWRELGGGRRIDVTALRSSATDDNSAARMIVGGALAAFVVDIAIRGDTRGVRGLDNLLYYLQQAGLDGGYAEDEVWPEAAQALGVGLDALSPMVAGSRLSIRAGLARAGLQIVESPERRRTLGARLLVDPVGRFVVRDVESGGTAASAGLQDGDLLLKINRTPIGPDETVATRYALTNYIRDAKAGAKVQFELLREGQSLEKSGTVRESSVPLVRLEEIPKPSATALIVRRSLFRPPSPSSGR